MSGVRWLGRAGESGSTWAAVNRVRKHGHSILKHWT